MRGTFRHLVADLAVSDPSLSNRICAFERYKSIRFGPENSVVQEPVGQSVHRYEYMELIRRSCSCKTLVLP
jgi:hypothetical protein